MARQLDANEAPSPLLEAASVLLESADRVLGTTALNKALFYLDLASLLHTGQTVTGETRYVALKAGPVVEGYHARLIAELERLLIAQQDDDDPSFKPVALLHAVRPKFLSQEHRKLATVIARWAKKLGAAGVSEFAHKNQGWVEAWAEGRGQGREIDMRLAMQQLMDEDPWLSEPMSSEERAAFDAADTGKASGW
jgi:hypothetical protein